MALTIPGDTGTRPPKVDDIERYWIRPPPEPSARCLWWRDRFRDGFRPNRRISTLGYYATAEWYGVYLWEYLYAFPEFPRPLADDTARETA